MAVGKRSLEGEVAIVTGAGVGIGRAIAGSLARAGAAVLLNDVDAAQAERAAGEIRAEGGRCEAGAGDVASVEAVRGLVDRAVERFGRVTLVVANAGVTLWSPFVPFEQVAALAASKSFHLVSAFRPTYNMAANLVQSYTAERAHHLLNLSFAQFQSDRDLVRLEARLERREQHLTALTANATSPFGDIEEYRTLRREHALAAPGTGGAAVEHALGELKPGDVIYVEKGPSVGRAAVLTVAVATAGSGGGVAVKRSRTISTTASIMAPMVATSSHAERVASGRGPASRIQVSATLGTSSSTYSAVSDFCTSSGASMRASTSSFTCSGATDSCPPVWCSASSRMNAGDRSARS